jgi:hypothetical protein
MQPQRLPYAGGRGPDSLSNLLMASSAPSWNGALAPAATPDPIVNPIAAAVVLFCLADSESSIAFAP